MRNLCLALFVFVLIAGMTQSCDRRKITRTDTQTSGTAQILADECYAPIVREQIAVFTGLNPEAVIEPVFVGETEVFELLLKDSIRMAITARDLTARERELVIANKRTPRSQKVAIDGLALIINRSNQDSLISMDMLRRVMLGEVTDWREIGGTDSKEERPVTVVFDKPNSSTVRFIVDSVCNGEPLGTNLFTADSNAEVIEYVARTPGALGVIGVNWISNPRDSLKLSFDDQIRVMHISRRDIPSIHNSYPPYPAYLATRDYPLVRETYAILTDVRGGLPSGFVSFVAGEAGQRIILKAGLVPATAPTRLVNVTTD